MVAVADDARTDDLETRVQRLVGWLRPAADAAPLSRLRLGSGKYSAPSGPCGDLLTIGRLCLKAARESQKVGGLLGRLLTSRSGRRREFLRNGAAAGALLIEMTMDRLGYIGLEDAPNPSRKEGQAMLDLLKPIVTQAGLQIPKTLVLGARVIRHPHSPWGGREYDIYLTREDMASGLSFSIVGPNGRTAPLRDPRAPELVLADAGEVKVETSGPLQFDVNSVLEGINMLYHDAETLKALSVGKTPDAVGQATFGQTRLARGQAAFRMTHLSGHTVEQPLIPHLIRLHYQSVDGVWSR